MIDNLLIALYTFASHILMSFSVNTLIPRYVNLSTNFREPAFSVEMSPFFIKAHVFCFVCIDMKARLSAPDYAAGIWLVYKIPPTIVV